MRKLLVILFVTAIAAVAHAGEGNSRLSLSAGALVPSTLNAQIGYETDLSYGNAVELFAEAGDRWTGNNRGRFWGGYYWDGGLSYKHRIVRYKNAMLRLRGAALAGAVQRKFFIGAELGFEYDYVFASGLRFCIIQKNNINFLHGDTFLNGLLFGLKVPI